MEDFMKYGLREVFRASYRCALDMTKGIKSKNRKKLVLDNTKMIYHDCKNNDKVMNYVMSKYGK